MIETKDLTKFAQHIFSHGRGASRAPALYPEREWFVITVLFLVIFLTGAVLSVWYYRVYQALPNQVTGREAISVPAYQAGAVAQAHEVYAAREERYSALYEAAGEEVVVPTAPAIATSSVASSTLSEAGDVDVGTTSTTTSLNSE